MFTYRDNKSQAAPNKSSDVWMGRHHGIEHSEVALQAGNNGIEPIDKAPRPTSRSVLEVETLDVGDDFCERGGFESLSLVRCELVILLLQCIEESDVVFVHQGSSVGHDNSAVREGEAAAEVLRERGGANSFTASGTTRQPDSP
jgi:hypothetical protein